MLVSMWADGISDREYYAQFGSYEEPEDDGCPECGASSGQACEEECGRDIRVIPARDVYWPWWHDLR